MSEASPTSSADAAPSSQSTGPPASGIDDALLQSVVWLTRHHGRERSAQSLLAELPLAGAMGPDQAIRAMREAGFTAGLIQRRIGEIHSLLLPAVLLLKNGDACILVRRLEPDPDRYEVVMPGAEAVVCQAHESELQAEYTGFAFVASPAVPLPTGTPDDGLLRDPDSHWLWGTLRRFFPYYRSALLAALMSNVLMLVIGLVVSVVYDKVIPHKAFVTLWALASGALLALLFDLLARQLRSHLIDMAGRKADLIIGSLLFRQTLGVRMEHRPASSGSYAHHLAQVEVVRDFFASATLSAISDLPFVDSVRRDDLPHRRSAGLGDGDRDSAHPGHGGDHPGAAAPHHECQHDAAGRPAGRAGRSGRGAGRPEGGRRPGPLPAPL